MEIIPFLIVALLPSVALLLVPRNGLGAAVVVTGLLLLLASLWAWQLNETCVSDGCIGAAIASGFAVIMGIAALVAGGIRWAIIAVKNGRVERSDEI